MPDISDTWNELKAKYRTTIELPDEEITFFKETDRFITEYGEELYIKCVYCVFLREALIILLKLYEESISKFKYRNTTLNRVSTKLIWMISTYY